MFDTICLEHTTHILEKFWESKVLHKKERGSDTSDNELIID